MPLYFLVKAGRAAGLASCGCADSAAGRRAFLQRLDERAADEATKNCGMPPAGPDARQSHLRRGWYWGTQEFAEKMLALAARLAPAAGNRNYRSSPLRKAHDTREAERLLAEGLASAGLISGDLEGLPGSDARKVAIAGLIRRRCMVANGWLAERLKMRSAANVSQQLRRTAADRAKLPKPLREFIARRDS